MNAKETVEESELKQGSYVLMNEDS